jgi:universal stress protein A
LVIAMLTFKKILCPTDFSEASYQGLKTAVELASDGQTEVCVLHVEPAIDDVSSGTGLDLDTYTEADRRAETVKNLCAVLEERVPPDVRSRPLLKQGDAATEIVRAAREESADLVVLTRHGAGGVQPGPLGTVAKGVLRTAPCPVLTISGLDDKTNNAAAVASAALHNIDSPRPEIEMASSHKVYLDGD